MSEHIFHGHGPDPKAVMAELRANFLAELAAERLAQQVESQQDMLNMLADAFNPFSAEKRAEKKGLEDRRHTITSKDMTTEIRRIKRPDEAAASAQERHQKNPELPAWRLMALRDAVLTRMGTPEEILEQVLQYFPEPPLADEALEYLLDTTEGEIAIRIATAREILRGTYRREVLAGRNMAAESRAYAAKGVGSATQLRQLYLGVTGDPKAHNAMFDKLSAEYQFDQLKDVVEFLLQSLGADLKSEGPSMERGKLYWLVTEVRSLQSVLGVFNFFLSREKLVERQFYEHGITKPGKLTFELMAKKFMKMVEERYPSAMKFFRLARELEIEEEIIAQIIVYTQFRDAVRSVAPRIYRSMKHRYDLLMALLDTLEELEEKLEEEEEREDKEQEDEEQEDGDL